MSDCKIRDVSCRSPGGSCKQPYVAHSLPVKIREIYNRVYAESVRMPVRPIVPQMLGDGFSDYCVVGMSMYVALISNEETKDLTESDVVITGPTCTATIIPMVISSKT